jgi:hypothetical protein
MQETFAVWKAGIAGFGKCQNVVVKLGGLGMTFGTFDFNTREMPPSSGELTRAYKPHIETCIVAFGPDRGMFESNFPSDGLSSSYAVLRNAFELLAAGYSPTNAVSICWQSECRGDAEPECARTPSPVARDTHDLRDAPETPAFHAAVLQVRTHFPPAGSHANHRFRPRR